MGKTRPAAALVLLLCACARLPNPLGAPKPAPPPPVPKDIRATSDTFALTLITGRRVQGVSLLVFNTGKAHARGEVVSSLKSWHAKLALDVPAFLIRHPEKGPVLFDTGLSSAIAGRALTLEGVLDPGSVHFSAEPGQDIVSQLRARELKPEDVRWVILSHLHADHAGMAHAFPEATVLVWSAEWDRVRALPRAPEGVRLEAIRERTQFVDFSRAKPFGPFDRGVDLFDDGSLVLVPLPGHTSGTMGLWANLDGGAVLLSGDASLVVDNDLDLALPKDNQMEDRLKFWRTLHVLRAARQAVPRLVIVPGHDLAPLRLYPRQDVELVAFPAKPGP